MNTNITQVFISIWLVIIVSIWIFWFFLIYRVNLIKEISRKILFEKNVLTDISYKNKYYYYFTWTYECKKEYFDTDNLEKENKIVFITSTWDVWNLSDYIDTNLWNFLDVNWLLNDVDALKDFYKFTDWICIYSDVKK